MLIHSEEKDSKCDVCGKFFSQRCELHQHKLVHSGVKSFIRDICGKIFSQKSKITTHMHTWFAWKVIWAGTRLYTHENTINSNPCASRIEVHQSPNNFRNNIATDENCQNSSFQYFHEFLLLIIIAHELCRIGSLDVEMAYLLNTRAAISKFDITKYLAASTALIRNRVNK